MSGSGEHREQDATDGIHIVHRYVFADAANRLAHTNELSGDARNAAVPTAADVGAIAKQNSDLTWWVLVNHSPITYKEITATLPPGGGYATIQNEGTPLTQRTILNFTGPLVTATDNAGATRTDVTTVGYGTTAGTVTEGNDTRIPTQGENDALAGTDGTPSGANAYVTNSDPRNTNARAPLAHTHAAADVVSGTFADARIAQSSVTQHQAALSIAQSQVTGVRREKHITVESPSAAEDISWFFTDRAVTLSAIRAVIRQQAGGATVTWTVRHSTDRSVAGNEAVTGGTTTTSQTTGSNVTVFNDATIPANSFVWIETTASSQVAELHLTAFYAED